MDLSPCECRRYIQIFVQEANRRLEPIKAKKAAGTPVTPLEEGNFQLCETLIKKAGRLQTSISAKQGGEAKDAADSDAGISGSIATHVNGLWGKVVDLRKWQCELKVSEAEGALQTISANLLAQKRKVENLLNNPSSSKVPGGNVRNLCAEDAVPLLLLVGEKRDGRGTFHCARFASRLCQMNSEFAKKYGAIGDLFKELITYADLVCRYQYAYDVQQARRDKLVDEWNNDHAVAFNGSATLAITTLAWGAMTGLRLRPNQMEHLVETVGAVTGSEARKAQNDRATGRVVSTIMGGGKTKVMIPTGCIAADALGLIPIILVATNQMPSVYKDTFDTLGQSMTVVNFRAIVEDDLVGFTKNISKLRRLLSEVEDAAQNGGKVILLDDAVLQRIVMEVTLISSQMGEGGAVFTQGRDETLERLQILSSILQTWKTKGRLFADEAHKTFDPTKSFILTDQSSSATISGRTFDIVHDLYEAMASASLKPPLEWSSSGPGGGKLQFDLDCLAKVRENFKLSTNQQAAVTEEKYREAAKVLADYMIVKLLRERTSPAAAAAAVPPAPGAAAVSPVGVTVDGPGNELTFTFDGPGGELLDEELKFVCTVADLQTYLTSPSFEVGSKIEAIDVAFSKAVAAKTQLAPFIGELRLVRGMLAYELFSSLKKTAGVNYGPGCEKNAALRVYKDGTPTDSQYAHAGSSIALIYQLAVNSGMSKPLWDKSVADSEQTARQEMRRTGKKSLNDTVAGTLFTQTFEGLDYKPTLTDALNDSDGVFQKVCKDMVQHPEVALRVMRNSISEYILAPADSREVRATAVLPFFSEVLAFTGTPGEPWPWDPMFYDKFCAVPEHIPALCETFSGKEDRVSKMKKLREFTVAPSSKGVADFLDGSFTEDARKTGLEHLCGIGDVGGILYQIAVNEAKKKGKIDPDPGYTLAVAIREYMASDHGDYTMRRKVNVGYEGRDGRRYMLLSDSDEPRMFEGSGSTVYEHFGISPENTILAFSQGMCVGVDVPMPNDGEFLLVAHPGDTGTSAAGQAALRARKLLESKEPLQYLRIAIPDHLMEKMVKSGADVRGGVTKNDLTGEDIVATFEFNDREMTAKQAMMAILCEIKRIVSNWVVQESVNVFSDNELASSPDKRNQRATELVPFFGALNSFLSDAHSFDPSTLYEGAQQNESLSGKALNLLRRSYQSLQIAIRSIANVGSNDARVTKLRNYFTKESGRLFDLCLKMEGNMLCNSTDATKIDVKNISDWLTCSLEDVKIQKDKIGSAERKLGPIHVQSSRRSVGEIPLDSDATVEVQVEVQKQVEMTVDTLQEYGGHNAVSTGTRLPTQDYWSGVGGIKAKELFERGVVSKSRGVGSQARNIVFATGDGRDGLAVSLEMGKFLTRSASKIRFPANSLANQERYELYSSVLGCVRGSVNFCLAYQNVIPIFHDSHPRPRYAIMYPNDNGGFSVVLVTEEEAKGIEKKIGSNDLRDCALINCTTGVRIASATFNDGIKPNANPQLAEAYKHAIEDLRLLRAMWQGDVTVMSSIRESYSRLVANCGADIELVRRFTELSIFSIPQSRMDRDALVEGIAKVDSMISTHNNDQLFRSGFNISDEMLTEVRSALGDGVASKLASIRPGETSFGEALAPLINLDLFSKYKPNSGGLPVYKYSPLVIYVIALSAVSSGRHGDVKRLLRNVDADSNKCYAFEAIRRIAQTKHSAAPGDGALFREMAQVEYQGLTYTGKAINANQLTHRCECFRNYSPCAFWSLNFDEDALSEILTSDSLDPNRVRSISPGLCRPFFTQYVKSASVTNLVKLKGNQLASSIAASILRARTNDGGEPILREVVQTLALKKDNEGDSKQTLTDLLRATRGTEYGNEIVKFLAEDPKFFDSMKTYEPLCLEMLKRKEFIERFKEDGQTLQRITNEYTPVATNEDVAQCDKEVVDALCQEIAHLLSAGQIYELIRDGKFSVDKLTKGRMALFDGEIDWNFEDIYPSKCHVSDDCCRLLKLLIERDYDPNNFPDGLLEVISRNQRLGVTGIDSSEALSLPSDSLPGGQANRETVDFFPEDDKGTSSHDRYRAWLGRLSYERVAKIKSDNAYVTVAYLMRYDFPQIPRGNFWRNEPESVRLAAIFARNLVLSGLSQEDILKEIRKLDPDNFDPARVPPANLVDYNVSDMIDKMWGSVYYRISALEVDYFSRSSANGYADEDVATICALLPLAGFDILPDEPEGDATTVAAKIMAEITALNLYKVFKFDRSVGGADSLGLAKVYVEFWKTIWEHLTDSSELGNFAGELLEIGEFNDGNTWFSCRERTCPDDVIHDWRDFFNTVCKKYPMALARLRAVDVARLRTLCGGRVIDLCIVSYILRWGGKDAIGALSAEELSDMDNNGVGVEFDLSFNVVGEANRPYGMKFVDMIRNVPHSAIEALTPEAPILRYIVKYGTDEQVAMLSPAQLWPLSRGIWKERAAAFGGRDINSVITNVTDIHSRKIRQYMDEGSDAREECSRLRAAQACVLRSFAFEYHRSAVEKYVSRHICAGADPEMALPSLLRDKEFLNDTEETKKAVLKIYVAVAPFADGALDSEDERRQFIDRVFANVAADVGLEHDRRLNELRRSIIAEGGNIAALLDDVNAIVPDDAKMVAVYNALRREFETAHVENLASVRSAKKFVTDGLATIGEKDAGFDTARMVAMFSDAIANDIVYYCNFGLSAVDSFQAAWERCSRLVGNGNGKDLPLVRMRQIAASIRDGDQKGKYQELVAGLFSGGLMAQDDHKVLKGIIDGQMANFLTATDRDGRSLPFFRLIDLSSDDSPLKNGAFWNLAAQSMNQEEIAALSDMCSKQDVYNRRKEGVPHTIGGRVISIIPVGSDGMNDVGGRKQWLLNHKKKLLKIAYEEGYISLKAIIAGMNERLGRITTGSLNGQKMKELCDRANKEELLEGYLCSATKMNSTQLITLFNAIVDLRQKYESMKTNAATQLAEPVLKQMTDAIRYFPFELFDDEKFPEQYVAAGKGDGKNRMLSPSRICYCETWDPLILQKLKLDHSDLYFERVIPGFLASGSSINEFPVEDIVTVLSRPNLQKRLLLSVERQVAKMVRLQSEGVSGEVSKLNDKLKTLRDSKDDLRSGFELLFVLQQIHSIESGVRVGKNVMESFGLSPENMLAKLDVGTLETDANLAFFVDLIEKKPELVRKISARGVFSELKDTANPLNHKLLLLLLTNGTKDQLADAAQWINRFSAKELEKIVADAMNKVVASADTATSVLRDAFIDRLSDVKSWNLCCAMILIQLKMLPSSQMGDDDNMRHRCSDLAGMVLLKWVRDRDDVISKELKRNADNVFGKKLFEDEIVNKYACLLNEEVLASVGEFLPHESWERISAQTLSNIGKLRNTHFKQFPPEAFLSAGKRGELADKMEVLLRFGSKEQVEKAFPEGHRSLSVLLDDGEGLGRILTMNLDSLKGIKSPYALYAKLLQDGHADVKKALDIKTIITCIETAETASSAADDAQRRVLENLRFVDSSLLSHWSRMLDESLVQYEAMDSAKQMNRDGKDLKKRIDGLRKVIELSVSKICTDGDAKTILSINSDDLRHVQFAKSDHFADQVDNPLVGALASSQQVKKLQSVDAPVLREFASRSYFFRFFSPKIIRDGSGQLVHEKVGIFRDHGCQRQIDELGQHVRENEDLPLGSICLREDMVGNHPDIALRIFEDMSRVMEEQKKCDHTNASCYLTAIQDSINKITIRAMLSCVHIDNGHIDNGKESAFRAVSPDMLLRKLLNGTRMSLDDYGNLQAVAGGGDIELPDELNYDAKIPKDSTANLTAMIVILARSSLNCPPGENLMCKIRALIRVALGKLPLDVMSEVVNGVKNAVGGKYVRHCESLLAAVRICPLAKPEAEKLAPLCGSDDEGDL
ncbi:MAG: hypothetical protein LBH53_01670 [Puniceicoccales bacterium]|nr:hypothetical protein [Puniceicoccales bacterium]